MKNFVMTLMFVLFSSAAQAQSLELPEFNQQFCNPSAVGGEFFCTMSDFVEAQIGLGVAGPVPPSCELGVFPTYNNEVKVPDGVSIWTVNGLGVFKVSAVVRFAVVGTFITMRDPTGVADITFADGFPSTDAANACLQDLFNAERL